MATRTSKAVPTIEPSATESVGITVREVIDAEPGVIRGYRAASDPELVTARKAHNVARREALTAKLLSDLS